MRQLEWSFDWPVRRAVAVCAHGTYLISGVATGQWMARFTRADTEPFRRTSRPVSAETCYPTMADAMRACHRHSEHYSADSSDRFTIQTPIP